MKGLALARRSNAGSNNGNHRLTFAALAIGALAYCILQSLILPALPRIQHDLHTTEASTAWLLTAFLVSSAVATPILGRLGDMFGKEMMLTLVLADLGVGCLLGALSRSIGIMIVARVIQGLGGAVFPLAFGIIRDEFPIERVAGGIGFLSTIIAGSSGLGILIGGPIVQHLGYSWLYWIPMALAVPGLLAAVFFVPRSPVRTPGRVDAPGALCLSGWLLALLIGVSEGPAWGWGSARILLLFAGSVILFVLWIRLEARSDHPLVDMQIMRIPSVWWINIAALLFGFGLFATIILIPEFLQTPSQVGYGFGFSPTMAGLYMLPSSTAMFFVGLAIGKLTARYGEKYLVIAGSIISMVPFAWLALSHRSAWEFLVASSINGIGIGLAYASMSSLVVAAVPRTHTGIATAMNTNIRTIGGSIGTQIVATIVTADVLAQGFPKEHGYTISFAVLACTFLAAGIAAMAIPGDRSVEPVVAEGAAPVFERVPSNAVVP